jgi:CRISPR system Cascade subunit CasE
MYLSRVNLDPRKTETAKAMARPSRFHGAVESCFSGERQHALWRVDKVGSGMNLLILSRDKPDLSSLTRLFGRSDAAASTMPYDAYVDGVRDDGVYRFRITANPTQKVQRKRVPMVITGRARHGDADGWLTGRLSKHGFVIHSLEMVEHRMVEIPSDGRKISFLSVTWEGICQVTNESAAKELLRKGLGHEKAFGCGLMTVMRL